jgi:Primase C terminal 2 (PriCT-2)
MDDDSSNPDNLQLPAGSFPPPTAPVQEGQLREQPADEVPAHRAAAHDFGIAERFLHALDPNTQRFTFFLVNETGWPSCKPIERHCTLAEIWPVILKLNQLNDRYAAYVTINETDLKGRKANNIVRVRALFVDPDTPESVAKILDTKQMGLRPSILVAAKESKAHAYWLSSDTSLEQFKPLQQALIEAFGGDPVVHDLPRIMRLPGTLHLKAEPLFIKMWLRNPLPAYETKQIVEAYGLSKLMVSPRGRPAKGARPRTPSVNDALATGVSPGWFGQLGDSDKDEALRQMLGVLPGISHGGRGPWLECLMAAHASGAPNAEDIARDWSTLGGDQYSDASFNAAWDSFIDKPSGVSIGTLIKLDSERGIDPTTGIFFNVNEWRAYADALQSDAQAAASRSDAQIGAPQPAAPAPQSNTSFRNPRAGTAGAAGAGAGPPVPDATVTRRAPFVGGRYVPNQALAMMNANYVFVRIDVSGEVVIVRHGGGPPILMREQGVKLELSNVFVRIKSKNEEDKEVEEGKLIYPWWKGHSRRNRIRMELFDPKRPSDIACGTDEFNFWRGFAIEPIEGTDKIGRLLRHIWVAICRRNKKKLEIHGTAAGMDRAEPRRASRSRQRAVQQERGTGKESAG